MPYLEDLKKYGGEKPAWCDGVTAQKRYYFDAFARIQKPCPLCGELLNNYEASEDRYSVASNYDLDHGGDGRDGGYQCPTCHTPLQFDLYLFGGQGWSIPEKDKEQIRQSRKE